jgi:F-type H+-transporting ATPase subunit a
MKTRDKVIAVMLGVITLLVVGSLFLRFRLPPVTVRAEAIPGLTIGGVPVTNAVLTMVVVDIILVALAVLTTRHMRLIPTGMQNLVEWLIEALYNLTELVAGKRWAPRFFTIVVTIFFYVLISNWFGLLPGLSAIGFCEGQPAPGHALLPGGSLLVSPPADGRLAAPITSQNAGGSAPIGCQPGEILIPLFRSPSTDLNNNLALALISVIMTQVFGVIALGPGYFAKFVNVKGMVNAFRPDEHGQRRGCAGMGAAFAFGAMQFFVGLLETISEFAKILSFSFRLFGNIFAGEVMLLVLASLVPLLLTLPFLGLEVFVGLIQAFIFYILTLAFFSLSTVVHNGHSEGAQGHR